MAFKPGSSSAFGEEAVPRLCSIVVDANTGIAQQIAENRTDLLDILPSSVLSLPTDDLGLTPAFLAIYHDRPEMIDYLQRRGVDFSKPCDSMEFGTPLFYAVTLGRTRLIKQLDLMGCSVRDSCDKLGQVPMVHAERMDDHNSIDAIGWALKKETRAAVLFMKHFLRIKFRKRYLRMRLSIHLLLRVVRGVLARKQVREKKKTRDVASRREARKIRRDLKIADGLDLASSDEDTVIPEVQEEEDL